MHVLLRDFSFSGIINPEHIYLFLDSPEGSNYPIEIMQLYLIRNEHELVNGLTLEIEAIVYPDLKLLEFLGVQRLSEHCFEFTMRVMENKFECLHHFYLHRIPSCEEGIRSLRRLYELEY